MNKIGWCDITLNPLTGCLNGCEYCYARKFANRLRGRFGYPEDAPFKPTFHPDKLQDIYNLPKGHKRVFLDSMGDWFSPSVDPAWIESVMAAVKARQDHTFLVLTKRPNNMPVLEPLPNLWIGVSINTNADLWRLGSLKAAWKGHRLVSIEPLQGFIDCDFPGIDWIIIGAESGNRKGKIMPNPIWIRNIVCRVKVPVFMKENLRQYLADNTNFIQEFPE